jgi:4-hydroxythreonine-4-phosphate dehydrogenase
MTIEKNYPRLVITAGEPAGIGPDILIQAAQKSFDAELVVIADPDLLEERATLLNLPLTLKEFDARYSTVHKAGTLKIIPINLTSKCAPGKLDVSNAKYVLESLETGCNGCLQENFSALVTAPVNKAIINQAGFSFSGHTEFLAKHCGSGYPVMMLANYDLRVALVTTHMPLNKVSESITPERLESVLTIVWHDLRRRFGITNPRLLVCGLNPHAGEDGHLGHEDKNIITPIIENLRNDGMQLLGPLPADTAFTPEHVNQADVIVCMYHDQGLPVIKAQGFGKTVNITLGLPIIRTSVDHGTALTLAGTGKANCASLLSAIECAIKLCETTNLDTSINTNHPSLIQQIY